MWVSAARPRNAQRRQQLAIAACLIRLLPFPPWTIPTTTSNILAVQAHGHRLHSTIARRSGSLPRATSPHLRCLRRHHHTVRTLSNMDTWAITPKIVARVQIQQRMVNPTQLYSSNNSILVRMRRSFPSIQTLNSKLLNLVSSPKDTMERVHSVSSSTTSFRRRSRGLSAMAKKIP